MQVLSDCRAFVPKKDIGHIFAKISSAKLRLADVLRVIGPLTCPVAVYSCGKEVRASGNRVVRSWPLIEDYELRGTEW